MAERLRVQMHLEVPEGVVESPLVALWKIADKGLIKGSNFTIGFGREVGERNEPETIHVNVYSDEANWVASYDVMDQGLIDLHVEKQVAGLPEIFGEDQTSDEEAGALVLKFVQEVIQETSEAQTSTSPNS